MLKDKNGPHPLDPFQRKIENSQALTIWVYNFLIEKRIISRPVGSPSAKERLRSVVSLLTAFRLGRDQRYGEQWHEAAQRAHDEALSDADIKWIKNLGGNELFAVWFFLRNAELGYTHGPMQQPLPSCLPPYLVSKVLEDDNGVPYNKYSTLGLEASPQTAEDMRSCALDFVSAWTLDLSRKRELLALLMGKADKVRAGKLFDFAYSYSNEEANQLWSYLRDKQNMIGATCESMTSSGIARIVGVFFNWPTPEPHKLQVETAAKSYIRDKSSKAKAKKVRAGLWLNADTRAKLVELAGGERKMSAYIEKLISEQEL